MRQNEIIHCIVMNNDELLELETGNIVLISERCPNSRLFQQSIQKTKEAWLEIWSKLTGPNLHKLNMLKIEHGLIF